MSYATKLKKAMDDKAMSRKQLCADAQVSASQLSMYLCGHSEPRPDIGSKAECFFENEQQGIGE